MDDFKPTHPEYRGDRKDDMLTDRRREQGYIQIRCKCCGVYDVNSYSDDYKTKMEERQLCFYCNFDVEREQQLEREHKTMTIIDGHIYGPGNRTSGSFRGMAGRRFDIEYIEPSAYAGQTITTFDLWSGSTMKPHLRERFPDTAKFHRGAQKVDFPKGSLFESCWNPPDGKLPPFPLPHTLKPNK